MSRLPTPAAPCMRTDELEMGSAEVCALSHAGWKVPLSSDFGVEPALPCMGRTMLPESCVIRLCPGSAGGPIGSAAPHTGYTGPRPLGNERRPLSLLSGVPCIPMLALLDRISNLSSFLSDFHCSSILHFLEDIIKFTLQNFTEFFSLSLCVY